MQILMFRSSERPPFHIHKHRQRPNVAHNDGASEVQQGLLLLQENEGQSMCSFTLKGLFIFLTAGGLVRCGTAELWEVHSRR